MDFEAFAREQNYADSWYVAVSGIRHGPFSREDIILKLLAGTLGREGHVWRAGMHEWVPITDAEVFAKAASAAAEVSEPTWYANPSDFSVTSPVSPQPVVVQTPTPEALQMSVRLENLSFKERPVENPLEDQRIEAVVNEEPVPAPRSSRPWKWFALSAIVIAGSGAAFFTLRMPSLPPGLTLIESERAELEAVTSRGFFHRGPQAAIARSTSDAEQPSFYIAADVKDGTKIAVEIEGVPETLVDALNVRARANLAVRHRFAETPHFTRPDGKGFPAGRYRVLVKCQGCADTRIAQKTYFIGNDDASYAKNLREYHEKLALQAQTELIEIKQFASTVEEQLSDMATQFNSAIASERGKKEWVFFAKRWRGLQAQLDSMFGQWTPEALKTDFYYGPMFATVKQVGESAGRIFERQDVYVRSGRKDGSLEAELASAPAAALSLLLSIHAKVALVERLPADSSGLPPQPTN